MSTVKLVWITPEAQNVISYCARVSNPQNQNNQKTAPKLLKYLIQNKHWSPFEMASMCVEINTTRAIAAQILRHRSFSFQEYCIAGHVSITTEEGNTIAVRDLYNQFKNGDKLPKLVCYDTHAEKFISVSVKEVFDTGIKKCVLVKTSHGNEITCTREHKFFTMAGFHDLNELKVGAQVFIYQNGEKQAVTIEKIMDDMECQTYDIEVDHVSHNYIANGIMTHNSQRYASSEDMGFETPNFRSQDYKNRQNSLDDLSQERQQELQDKCVKLQQQSMKLYTEMLESGIAKECARMVLPLSTMTRMYMSGTIRSWMHYCEVRCDPSTQLEHREIADQIRDLIKKQIPAIYEAMWETY